MRKLAIAVLCLGTLFGVLFAERTIGPGVQGGSAPMAGGMMGLINGSA